MMWMIIDKNHINHLNKKLLNNYSYKYWKQRLLGYGTGEDTRVASKSKIKLKKEKYKNIMMLHIFKDLTLITLIETGFFQTIMNG